MKIIVCATISTLCFMTAAYCGWKISRGGSEVYWMAVVMMGACGVVASKLGFGPQEEKSRPEQVPEMYYLQKSVGKVEGPYSFKALSIMFRRGSVPPLSQIAKVGMDEWIGIETLIPYIEKAASSKEKKAEDRSNTAFGMLLMLIGAGLGWYFWFFFDTTVSTDFGRSVHNIGLMNDRMIGMMAAAVLFFSGIFVSTKK